MWKELCHFCVYFRRMPALGDDTLASYSMSEESNADDKVTSAKVQEENPSDVGDKSVRSKNPRRSKTPKESSAQPEQTTKKPSRKRVKMQSKNSSSNTLQKPVLKQQLGSATLFTIEADSGDPSNSIRRVKSMFGNFIVNADFDVIFEDDVDGSPFNPYAMPVNPKGEFMPFRLCS